GDVTSGGPLTETGAAGGGAAAKSGPTAKGSAGGAAATKAGGGAAQAAGPAAGVACAPGRNGGATDVGVTASSIKLGATVVQSGIGASFLGDVRFAMQAITDKANRAGGICGRRIDLMSHLVDDGWSYEQGGTYLRNLV